MLRHLFNKYKYSKQGFTLVEVLVSILIVSGFVLIGLNALILATFFRIEAQKRQIASQMIQQDVEGIRFRSQGLQQTLNASTPPESLPDLCLARDPDDRAATPDEEFGLAQRLWDDIETNLTVPADRQLLGDRGKALRIIRTGPKIQKVNPWRVLRVYYRVVEQKDDGTWPRTTPELVEFTVLEDFLEIVPDVAFECPY